MTLLALYLGCAVTAGLIALFRPRRLPRAWPLLVLAALPQLLAIAGIRHALLALCSLLICLIWGWQNRTLPGALLLSLGCLLNLGTMTLYGGSMPVTTDTLAAIGVVAEAGALLRGAKDVVIEAGGIWWLGDWIILPVAQTIWIVSPGDLLVAAGLIYWLFVPHNARKEENDVLSHGDLAGTVCASETSAQ